MTEQATTQDVNPAAAAPVAADPFSLDENSLVSLTPEQRAGLDPIIDGWKKKATAEITRRETETTGKYKPYEDKATALDKLTQYQPFVQWWNAEQLKAQAQTNPLQAQAIGQTKPTDVATPQEWQDAIVEASQGDGTKLQTLQARMMATWATPFVKELKDKQQTLDTKLGMRDLFESHPDAKELDLIGLDPKTKEGISLLETGLDWAENNNKSIEEGYELAKRWADSMKVTEQQRVMGMINDKKQTTTAGPSTSTANVNIVEVGTVDELLKQSMEAQLSGNKDAKFVLKK
jgi:hypothetical protein